MKTRIVPVISLLFLVLVAGCDDPGLSADLGVDLAAPTFTSTAPAALAPIGEPLSTNTPEPTAIATPKPTAARLLVWVRQEPAAVNPDKQALGWDYGEDPRRKQSYVTWEVGDDRFTSRQRYQEDEFVWYDDVVISVIFERPPLVLNPELGYELQAAFSHSHGVVNTGYEGLGETFLWDVSRGSIDPPIALAYFPYAPNFDGSIAKKWMLRVPPPAKPGEELELSAAMMNWPPGRVVWTYLAEYH